MCSDTTKGTAGGKTGGLLIEKSTRVQRHIEYIPKKCSNRREEIEDQIESGCICRV